jgi:Spy/CpxP family protein refolding chaperone
MTPKRWKYLLTLLLVINVTALVTFAYHRWFRPGGETPAAAGTPAEAFARMLWLSSRQEMCLRDIRASFDAETEDLQTRIQEKKGAMVEEMKKASPDGAALDRLVDEVGRLQTEIQKKAVARLLEEKSILTEEQKEAYVRMFEDHLCRRGKGARTRPGGPRRRGPSPGL